MDQLLLLFDLARRDLIAIPCAMIWFYALYRSLKALVFDPYLKLEALRDGATTGAIHDARVLTDKADKLSDEIEAKIRLSRDEALARREALLQETRKTVDAIQGEAAAEAKAFESKEHAALQAERSQLEGTLGKESAALAGMVKTRLAELAN